MEGLGTGKPRGMLLSCPALTQVQSRFSMGEGSGVASLSPWHLCSSQGHHRRLVLPPRAAAVVLVLTRTTRQKGYLGTLQFLNTFAWLQMRLFVFC